ncbi:hypothetical protein [Halalkalibacter lacteus]|uniref:hypothetical protein n=1 Tax=Halalkalibacter lacteus TaxID=3090663 RepID=UPI002FCB2637
MTYHPDRMKSLLEQDRFLSSAYDDVLNHIKSEEEALFYVFQHYVNSDPIFQNAYDLLTEQG